MSNKLRAQNLKEKLCPREIIPRPKTSTCTHTLHDAKFKFKCRCKKGNINPQEKELSHPQQFDKEELNIEKCAQSDRNVPLASRHPKNHS